MDWCRSFISIIFPLVETAKTEEKAEAKVSILYKYHISPVAKNEALATSNAVSILYKYHISHGFMKNLFVIHNSSCRSFISIIFPQMYLSML